MDLLGRCGDILRLLLAGVALSKMSCGSRKIWNEAVKLYGLLAYSAAFGAMENEHLFWFLFKADFWLTACVQFLPFQPLSIFSPCALRYPSGNSGGKDT